MAEQCPPTRAGVDVPSDLAIYWAQANASEEQRGFYGGTPRPLIPNAEILREAERIQNVWDTQQAAEQAPDDFTES